MVVIDYLLDTNVVSKFLAGDENVKLFLDGKFFCINTVVYIELIQGSIKKRQRNSVKKFLSRIISCHLTPAISKRSIRLIDKYSSSEGLFLADALIAATAIEHDLKLVTFNTKDFQFIKDLSVIKP
jgi:predicted nucleic acid-binding protein